MNDFDSPAPAPATPPLDDAARRVARNVLSRLVDTAIGFSLDEASALHARVKDDLFDASNRAQGSDDYKPLWEAFQRTIKRKQDLVELLQKHLPRAIQLTFESDRPNVVSELDKTNTLRLLDADDVEREVRITSLTRRLEDLSGETLAPLTHRISKLLDLPDVAEGANPFRPEVFVRGFVAAWDTFDDDQLPATILLRVLRPEHFLPLNALYGELNEALIERGVLPQERIIVKRDAAGGSAPAQALWNRSAGGPAGGVPNGAGGGMSGAGGPGGGAPADLVGSALSPTGTQWNFDPARFMQQVGLLIEQLGADRAGATPGTATTPLRAVAPNADLLGAIEKAQAAVTAQPAKAATDDLAQLGASEAAQQASEIDRATIEMLARVFDFVLRDAAIPADIKVLLASLQVPVLRAALLDRQFFLSADHPARRLIDVLARAAVSWSPEAGKDDPLYRAIEATVQRVATRFHDDLSVFDRLCGEFQTFFDKLERKQAAAIEQRVAETAREEMRQLASAEVDRQIKRRFELATIDDTLGAFLREPWRKVLIERCMARETAPDGWKRALHATDILIWSVLPKINSTERAELLRALPGLVQELNAGFDAINWVGIERNAFMQYLMDAQAKMARASQGAAPRDTASKAFNPDDDALRTGAAAPVAAASAAPAAFTRGDWYELDLGDGAPTRYRIAWISPMQTKFVLSSRDGARGFVKTEVEMLDMLRTGTLRRVDTTPVVQRAISAALQPGAAPTRV